MGKPNAHPGSCRGRYHTDRQPGAALQNTAICPAGPPARSRAAWAGGQSHSTHDTVIRPGPPFVPVRAAFRVAPPSGSPHPHDTIRTCVRPAASLRLHDVLRPPSGDLANLVSAWFRRVNRGNVSAPGTARPARRPRPGGEAAANDPCGPGNPGPVLLLGVHDAAVGDVPRRSDRGASGVPRFPRAAGARGARNAGGPSARAAGAVAAQAATGHRARGGRGRLVRRCECGQP
jgi:hypothetical protein